MIFMAQLNASSQDLSLNNQMYYELVEIKNILQEMKDESKPKVVIAGEQVVVVDASTSTTINLNGKYWYDLDLRIEWASTPSGTATATIDINSKEKQNPLVLTFDATIIRSKLKGVKINKIIFNNKDSAVNLTLNVAYLMADKATDMDIELRSS